MKRVFFEGARQPNYATNDAWASRERQYMSDSPGYGIFDSLRSNIQPIAFTADVSDAALIVAALNGPES